MSFSRSLSLSLVLAGTVALAAPRSSAIPCAGADDLAHGPCCSQIVPNIPKLVPFAMPALGVCWEKCQPTSQSNLRIQWGAPQQVLCSQYEADVTVLDSATGLVLLKGKLHLDYSRTWYESTSSAAQNLIQVWRFLAKVDFVSNAAPGAVVPCPVPSCLPPQGNQNTAFFYGYVDYAQDCNNLQQWTASAVLFHGSDFFQHKPVVSSRPGSYHPGRSYAIVAPHTAANPFVPALLAEPGGPFFSGIETAMRSMDANTLTACTVLSKLAGGQRVPFANGCLEFFSTVAPQHTLSLLEGMSACFDPTGLPGSFKSLAVGFPTLPWFHLVGTSIGRWTTAMGYPGPERVWVDEGLFQSHYSCAGQFFDVYYGATTADGFPAMSTDLTTPLPPFFLDLADNYTFDPSAPGPFPLVGHVMPSQHIIHVSY